MSRVGHKPIPIPSGVTVSVQGPQVLAEGKLGKLSLNLRAEVAVEHDSAGQVLHVSRKDDERVSRSLHGLTRSLLQNMVHGVSEGFVKKLEIVGVGYGAFLKENQLQLRVGYANEIHKTIPPGLTVTCPDQTHIVVQGCDKQQVGQFAAEVRAARKPEPYKGKGIRYENEFVKIKPGKTAT